MSRRPLYPGVAPLDRARYNGMRLWPKAHHTVGGVGINAQARVLDLDGLPIPGRAWPGR